MNAVKQTQDSNTRQIIIHKSISSKRIHKRNMALQRASGVVLLLIAILSAVISQECTAAVILIPLALYITLTKKHVMCFN